MTNLQNDRRERKKERGRGTEHTRAEKGRLIPKFVRLAFFLINTQHVIFVHHVQREISHVLALIVEDISIILIRGTMMIFFVQISNDFIHLLLWLI